MERKYYIILSLLLSSFFAIERTSADPGTSIHLRGGYNWVLCNNDEVGREDEWRTCRRKVQFIIPTAGVSENFSFHSITV